MGHALIIKIDKTYYVSFLLFRGAATKKKRATNLIIHQKKPYNFMNSNLWTNKNL